jgi:signal transduction histidine kinase
MPLMENTIEANLGYGNAHGVTFVIGKESPAVTVQADEARLMQVMSNLMSNAAKFSAKGDEVEISVTATGDSVRVAVTEP